MQRKILLGIVVGLFASLGCEAPVCKKMRACCAELNTEEWVGDACGSLAQNVHEPASCAAINDAIAAAAQSRKFPLPTACQ